MAEATNANGKASGRAKTIAEHAVDVAREYEVDCISWGDAGLCDAVSERSGIYERLKNPHPLNRMQAVLNGLERAPDLWEKKFYRGADCSHRQRLLRCFWLREASE